MDLDVLVHGEFERNDMVEYFGELLSGFLFTEKAWVQSYGTRCVKPPIIWGDVRRLSAMTVEWSTYAQSLTKRPMKGMLTGPVTILNWSFPREDISIAESTKQIALAIRDEVLDLEKNGIKIIQVDEAALRPIGTASTWTGQFPPSVWYTVAVRQIHRFTLICVIASSPTLSLQSTTWMQMSFPSRLPAPTCRFWIL